MLRKVHQVRLAFLTTSTQSMPTVKGHYPAARGEGLKKYHVQFALVLAEIPYIEYKTYQSPNDYIIISTKDHSMSDYHNIIMDTHAVMC